LPAYAKKVLLIKNFIFMKYILINIVTKEKTECLKLNSNGYDRYYANEHTQNFSPNDLVAHNDPYSNGGNIIDEIEYDFYKVYPTSPRPSRGTMAYAYFENGYKKAKENFMNLERANFIEAINSLKDISIQITVSPEKLYEIWQSKKTIEIFYK
jgi:hypothetical protein